MLAFKIMTAFAMVFGLFLIIGTKLDWKFLTDPSEKWAPFYSHSTLKKYFGSDFLVGYNYVVGSLFIIVSLIFIYDLLTGNVGFK